MTAIANHSSRHTELMGRNVLVQRLGRTVAGRIVDTVDGVLPNGETGATFVAISPRAAQDVAISGEWINLSEVTFEDAPVTAPVKTITYDPITKDYRMDLDDEFVGYERSYHAAEVELDRLAYEQLDRAGIEPELLQTATALDGGSSPDEIAAEYAAALPTVATVTINEPGLREASILVTAGSTAELVRYDWPLSANLWTALLIDGSYYPLIMTKFIAGRPHHQEALDRALTQVQQAIAALQTPTADQPATGHNLITPDPAECPDISAPQPVSDLSTCERYSMAPALLIEPEPEPVPAWLNAPIDPADVPPSEPEHDPCAHLRTALADLLSLVDRELPQFADTVIVQAARALLKG